MQAIILAGGMGSRLMPLTQDKPKPMIPVLNKPLMEYSVELLKDSGINNVGVTVMYLPQYIKNYFGDGKKYDLNLKYFEEKTPMGTAGSVKLCENFIEDTFVVISGDALTNINIQKIYKYHKTMHSDVTIVLSKQANPLEYGVVLTETDGKIVSFVEKPQWENVVSNTVNTGIYFIEKHVLDKIPPNTPFDFSKDLFPQLMKENYKLYGYITEDYWCDLGNAEAYLKATQDILEGKVFGKKYENVLEENVVLSDEIKLVPPVYIGKNSIISGKSTIGPDVVLGENCILENVTATNSIVWNNSIITDCKLDGEVIGSHTNINKAVFKGNNVIGSNVNIKNNVLLKNGAKVFDNVTITPETVISGDIKENNYKQKELFNDGVIQGIWNHDIKAEHLLGIASSFKAEKVVIASNKTALGSSVANLLASFYSLCGATVYLSNSYIGSCRFFACINKMKGVYINEDNERLNINLIDEKGLNITSNAEKKIDFNLVDYSLNRGRIIKLNSLDIDFEYFLNASFPFVKYNVEVYSDYGLKLHNIINKKGDFKSQSGISKAVIIAKNNTVTDVYYDNQRISAENFMKLKLELAKMLQIKEVFMPPYVTDDIVNDARNNSINILNLLQHQGNSMAQADSFNNSAVLLEYVPHFFALALGFYLQKETIKNTDKTVITRYDFNVSPEKSIEAIFNLNKNKTADHITARYKGGYITVIPRNNGYSFTAYGRFLKEEYAPDIMEEFIKENIEV